MSRILQEIIPLNALPVRVVNQLTDNQTIAPVIDYKTVNKLSTTHPFSGNTREGQYQNCKNNLDFTEARDSEWQWHQLDHMQVCTSHQTDNHVSTPQLSFYRPDALPAAQPTASKH